MNKTIVAVGVVIVFVTIIVVVIAVKDKNAAVDKDSEDYSYSFGFPVWGEYNNPYIRGYPWYGPFVGPSAGWPRFRPYRRHHRRWW